MELHALLISLVAFAAIFGGALVGVGVARLLPQSHLAVETRTAVSVSMAVVGTLAALVLSLMITNANSSFNLKENAIGSLAVDIVKLDRTLKRYGPETASARDALQAYAKIKLQELLNNKQSPGLGVPTLRLLENVDDRILALPPGDDRQSHLKGDALDLVRGVADSRWTLVAKGETTLSSPFLALLIFWLALLFASFGLFAPRNLTVIVVLLLSGIAISGGVFMILELGSATSGLVRISVEPIIMAITELMQPSE